MTGKQLRMGALFLNGGDFIHELTVSFVAGENQVLIRK